jgi:signal transduction histidine kinase
MAEVNRLAKISSRSYDELEATVRELNVKLAIANEALEAEIKKREWTEKRLQELEEEYHLLITREKESASIVRELEDRIQEALKMEEVGKIMASALAHDLRNLLTAISSHAQFCIENMKLNPPLDENLQMIFENSKRASKLIKDFLEFVKFVKSDTLNCNPVNVNELVTSMWNIAKLDAGLHEITFRARLNEIPEVFGDVEKLERVFLNLLLNAIQAVSKEGEITVQTCFLPSMGVVEVNIMDNGPGIPESYRDKIFEPFFTTKEDGTGLGLSICHSIIQQHKGTITVDCNGRQGTKFSVKLPAIRESELLKPSNDPDTCDKHMNGIKVADASEAEIPGVTSLDSPSSRL